MAKLALFGGSKVLPNGFGVKWPIFDQADEAALLKTFRSGSWWRGGDIKSQAASVCGKFEREFAAWHDAPFGLCVPNGTIAVELAAVVDAVAARYCAALEDAAAAADATGAASHRHQRAADAAGGGAACWLAGRPCLAGWEASCRAVPSARAGRSR